MSKAEEFKNAQTPRWQDGQLANGANFQQLIEAIAALVEETKAEAVREASQAAGSGYTDTQAKTIVKNFLDTLTDYQETQMYKGFNTALEQVNQNLNGFVGKNQLESLVEPIIEKFKTEGLSQAVANAVLEQLKSIVKLSITSYSVSGDTLTLYDLSDSSTQYTITSGSQYLASTSEKLIATPISVDKSLVELVRPDGARLVFNVNERSVKPAALLIG